MTKLKLILLLDENSRQLIKTNLSELGMNNIIFVNHLTEITKDMLNMTKDVLILEGYLKIASYYSDLKLFKSLLGLNYYFIGSTEAQLAGMHNIATVYKSDISLLDMAMIESAIFQDTTRELKEDKNIVNPVYDTARKIVQDSENYDAKIQKLATEYLALQDYNKQVTLENKVLFQQMEDLQSVSAKLKTENTKLLKGYTNILLKARDLNESLRRYEPVLTSDIYTKVSLQTYNNKPNIIYIKEYEELINFDSFLLTLFNTLQLQQHASVKILRLYDSTGAKRILTIPNYYKVLNNSYLTEDVLCNDFLCKYGDYTKVLDILLTNKVNLDFLIIVDCKDYLDTVMSGSYLQLNTCRDKNHLDAFSLSTDNTIINAAYSEEEYLCWDTYPEIQNLSDEDKFLYLSARPVIQKILHLSKLYIDSV